MTVRTALFTVLFWLAGIGGVLGANIPLPKGQFESTTTGSFAVCLNSSFTQEVACSTSGAVAVP